MRPFLSVYLACGQALTVYSRQHVRTASFPQSFDSAYLMSSVCLKTCHRIIRTLLRFETFLRGTCYKVIRRVSWSDNVSDNSVVRYPLSLSNYAVELSLSKRYQHITFPYHKIACKDVLTGSFDQPQVKRDIVLSGEL